LTTLPFDNIIYRCSATTAVDLAAEIFERHFSWRIFLCAIYSMVLSDT